MIYMMEAKQFANADELRSSAAEVKARLRALRPPAALPAPIVRVHAEVFLMQPKHGAPLDMLARPSWRFLLALVALRHDFSQAELVGEGRLRPLVAARHEAMYMVAKHTPYSLPRIGRFFGGRDHTTVLHALRKFPPFCRERAEPLGMCTSPLEKTPHTSRQKRVLDGLNANEPPERLARELGTTQNAVIKMGYRLNVYRAKAKAASNGVGA